MTDFKIYSKEQSLRDSIADYTQVYTLPSSQINGFRVIDIDKELKRDLSLLESKYGPIQKNNWNSFERYNFGTSFNKKIISVDINANGDRLIIGQPYENNNATYDGVARVFKFIDNKWEQLGGDFFSTFATNLFFNGWDVNMNASGDRVIIGSIRANPINIIFEVTTIGGVVDTITNINNNINLSINMVFILNGGDNNAIVKITEVDSLGRITGISVENGGTGYNNGLYGISTAGRYGSTRVFDYDPDSPFTTDLASSDYGPEGWKRVGTEIWGSEQYDSLGRQVVISDDGNIVAVSADNASFGGRNYTRVYTYVNDNWVQMGGDIINVYDGDSGFSMDLSGDGKRVAIGSPYFYLQTQSYSRVFEYDATKTTNEPNESSPDFGPIGWRRVGSDIFGEEIGEESGYDINLNYDGTVVAMGAINNSGGRSGLIVDLNYSQIETTLTAIINGWNGNPGYYYIDVDDNDGSKFPNKGYIHINDVSVYYDSKNNDRFYAYLSQDFTIGTTIKFGIIDSIEIVDGGTGFKVGDVGGVIDGRFEVTGIEQNGKVSNIRLIYKGYGINIVDQKNVPVSIKAGNTRVFKEQNSVWNQLGDDIDPEDIDAQGWGVELNRTGNVLAVSSLIGEGLQRGLSIDITAVSSVTGVITEFKINNGGKNYKVNDLVTTFGTNTQFRVTSVDQQGSVLSVEMYQPSFNPVYIMDNVPTYMDTGHARVFKWDGVSWVQQGGIIPGANLNSNFSRRIAINEEGNILVGFTSNVDYYFDTYFFA